MALQVWLPLTKDLRNQGLSNVTVTNNGATFNSAGKLGGCYQFGPNKNIKLMEYAPTFSSFREFSLSVWFKCTAQNTGHVGSALISCGNWNQPTHLLNLALGYYDTDHYTTLFITNNSSWAYGYSYNFQLNTWYHVVLTNDQEEEVKAYVNGELIGSATNGVVPTDMEQNWICIGNATYYSSFTFNGFMNDIRIYDHCLSEMEVKQLSKGLVLHYLLNDKYCESVTNLASAATGGWNNSGNCTRLFNDTSLDSSKPTSGPVISVKITTAGNCALTCGTTGVSHPSKTLTFSIWCYLSGPQENNSIYIRSTKTDGNVGNLEYNGSVLPTTWPTNKWIRLEKTITTASDATTFYFCTYANVLDRYVALNGWQIEEKNHTSPWTPPGTTRTANDVEYDCSGFCNNGTRYGTFNFNSETPKYEVSTQYNGTDNTLKIPFDASVWPDNFTMSVWFRKDELGSKSYETLFGGPSGFEMDTRAGAASTLSLYMASTRGGTLYTGFQFGEWYMVTLVNDGTHELYYINGELVKTIDKKSMPVGNYWIGSWASATSQNYKGLLSDARIYATALSADDVKSLYQNSAYIDSNGNVYGAVHSEV